jgi:chemotaxis signal transduction protein
MDATASCDVLIFRVGVHHFSITTQRVREIILRASLVMSPGQPSILAGFLNLRGVAVPVVRISQLFGFGESMPGQYTPLIILDGERLDCERLDCERMLIAIEADGVEEVTEILKAEMRELGDGHSLNDCAQAAFSWKGHEVLMLSCDQLLLAKEKECLREFQAATQLRLNAVGPTTR